MNFPRKYHLVYFMSFLMLIFSGIPADVIAKQEIESQENENLNGQFVIGAEDVLEVVVWKSQDLSRIIPVRPDGMISLPLIGDVVAAGKTTMELKNIIQEKYSSFIDLPVVTVIVTEVKSWKIFIQGEVRNPGVYSVGSEITVLQAISLAGGFTEFAKKNRIILIRENQRIKINYENILKGKESDRDIILESGDIVVIL